MGTKNSLYMQKLGQHGGKKLLNKNILFFSYVYF